MSRIVIIGGGFAGTTLAGRLIGRLPSDWEVLLISEESYTTYNPLLPEVVGASIFPEHAVAPLREVIGFAQGTRFVMGEVTGVDLGRRTLSCLTLSGIREFGFEHLVLAFGNRARLDLIPGMAEHALPLKTIGDALHIRNVVLRRLAMMELETDPETRARLGHFVVIGGGFSGVEVAGALIDCVKSIARYYRRVDPATLRVSLVHNVARLLPELPAMLGAKALSALHRRGVRFRLDSTASVINANGLALSDGSHLEAATVIATIGTAPNSLIERLSLATVSGRINVDPSMEVPGLQGVWALGDCAHIVNAETNQASPPTAQFAVRQAQCLAENLLDTIAGRALPAFRYRPRGSMAVTGHLSGVAEIGGVQLSGLPAWLLWRAYYLLQLPTLRRKVRLFVEWTWGMFFPSDITHIRFTRSGEADVADRAPSISAPDIKASDRPRVQVS
jgi:NADH:ubiquinone reductase (H+-translocating)